MKVLIGIMLSAMLMVNSIETEAQCKTGSKGKATTHVTKHSGTHKGKLAMHHRSGSRVNCVCTLAKGKHHGAMSHRSYAGYKGGRIKPVKRSTSDSMYNGSFDRGRMDNGTLNNGSQNNGTLNNGQNGGRMNNGTLNNGSQNNGTLNNGQNGSRMYNGTIDSMNNRDYKGNRIYNNGTDSMNRSNDLNNGTINGTDRNDGTLDNGSQNNSNDRR